MTRTEKVREVLNAVLRDYGLMNEMLEANKIVAHPFTVGPSAVTEALSLLDGHVIVPREPNEAMQNRLTDLVKAMHADQHSRDMAAWEAVKGYRAMIAAAEEGE